MAVVAKFDTPGALRDLPVGSPFYDVWHDLIDGLIEPSTPVSGPGAYVDPSETDIQEVAQRAYTWTGFPRPLLVQHRDDRAMAFRLGEDRANQIEYLEWHVDRVGSTIKKVVFSTETPEYWKTLAQVDEDRVVELYQQYVHPSVVKADLFPAGEYDPMNRWNTTDGIIHYIMPINSMKDLLGVSAEVERTGRALDGYDPLPYARATGADARLAMDIWSMSRKDLAVATANPPGLSMIDWDDTGWVKPDGSPVGRYWHVDRGVAGAALRLRYELPEDEKGFTIDQIRIGGRPITTGGEMAEHIVMSAHGVAGRIAP